MKNFRSSVHCGVLLCVLHLTAFSQIARPQHPFVLNADYSRFWQNDSTAYLEIATAIYPNLAILRQDSAGYHGKVELVIHVRNRLDGTPVSSNRFHIPIEFADSVALARTRTLANIATYSLGCGSYSVSVLGYDLSDRTRRDTLTFSVDITRRPDSAVVSDIELCSNITESSDKTDPFYKNTYRVIPNPSCMFGSTTQPVVFTYVEIYNVNAGMLYELRARITDTKGDVKKQRTYRRRFSRSNIVDAGTLNVASIASGKYSYEMILADTLGREIAKMERPIFLYNPNVQQSRGLTFSARIGEFAGMTAEELEAEFRPAQYIAHSEDIDAFEKLTTADARREFLAKFWTRIESSEAGRSDLTRAIYLQRVLTANQRYRGFGRDGWRTDRGRVYLMYGEPDEIQRFPSSQDSKPYEIWNYHQIEGGVEFIFIDRTGLNEYTLVHSTKRGEIQDESWEQFLH